MENGKWKMENENKRDNRSKQESTQIKQHVFHARSLSANNPSKLIQDLWGGKSIGGDAGNVYGGMEREPGRRRRDG